MKKCVIEGCDHRAITRGWCATHYDRWWRTGDVDAGRPIRTLTRRVSDICAYQDCDLEVKAKGYCAAHYRRLTRYGDPAITVAIRRDPVCSIEGCGRPHTSHGWCNLHWRRNRDYGDPLAGPAPTKNGRVHPSHSAGTCICTRCELEQPLGNFLVDRNKSSGHHSHCRGCEAQWRRENSDSAYEPSRRRRANVRGQSVDRGISRASLRIRRGDSCHYCGVQLEFRNLGRKSQPSNYATVDHVVPISRGGTHSWENVVLACQHCNCSKRNSIYPTEWTAVKLSESSPSRDDDR